jgi:hypothetical protein
MRIYRRPSLGAWSFKHGTLALPFQEQLAVQNGVLQDRLGLGPDELKAMVLATPRILMQSVEYSPKIALLEESSTAGRRKAIAVLRRIRRCS